MFNFLAATAAQEAHLSVHTSICPSVCLYVHNTFATLQNCNIATMYHCNFKLCNFATLQHRNRVQIVWTAAWGEPGDNWKMVTTLGWWPQLLTLWWGPQQLWTAGWVESCDKGMIVTIIHLSEAPKPKVGNSNSWLLQVYLQSQVHSFSRCCCRSCQVQVSSYNIVRHCLIADLS